MSKGFTLNNFSPIVCPEAGEEQEIGGDWVWQQCSWRHIPAPCCAPWGCVFRKQEALAMRAMYYHPLNSLHCCFSTKTQGRLFIWNQNCMKISWGSWSSICGIFFLTLLYLSSSQHVNPVTNEINGTETSGAKSVAFGGAQSWSFLSKSHSGAALRCLLTSPVLPRVPWPCLHTHRHRLRWIWGFSLSQSSEFILN